MRIGYILGPRSVPVSRAMETGSSKPVVAGPNSPPPAGFDSLRIPIYVHETARVETGSLKPVVAVPLDLLFGVPVALHGAKGRGEKTGPLKQVVAFSSDLSSGVRALFREANGRCRN